MKLYRYKCPECERVMDERDGALHPDGSLSVKCRFCENVERIAPHTDGRHAA